MNSRNPEVEYRPIAGFPGYEVGADGTIWSRLVKGPQTEESRLGSRWKQLSSSLYGGYLAVCLCAPDGKHISKKIHFIVLETFIGPRPKGKVARHFPDRNRRNCAITNLRWGTHKENAEDRDRDGMTARGERNKNSKLTESDIRIIRAATGSDAGARMAKQFGICRTSAYNIRTRKTWTHVL